MSLFGGGGSAAQTETRIGSLQVQSTGYGVTVAVVMGTAPVNPTLMYYTDFVAHQHDAGGGKGGSSGKSYTYTASIMLLVCEGGGGLDFGKLWVNKNIYNDAADVNFEKFNGVAVDGVSPQLPWGYLTTKHPDDAVSYNRFAYIAAADYELSNSASIGNHKIEVKGFYRGAGPDASVRNCMIGLLTSSQWGLAWDVDRIDALAQMDSYCEAYGIVISPALTEQKKAAEILSQWAKIANCGIVWSGGKLKCIPYSDTAAGSFVPDPTTGLHLDDSDFIVDEGEDPVKVSIKLQADAYNHVTVEYESRAQNYDVRTATATDDADIDNTSLRRMDTQVFHEIRLPAVAATVARQVLQRELYIRKSYDFNLSFAYALLEPMDVVFLTEPSIGLNDAPVRITKIIYQADGRLGITAEEMPFGVSHTEADLVPDSNGYVPTNNIAVGPMNAPMIFIAPPALTVSSYQVWVALSNPDANYGGCVVWSSFDDAHYTRRGTFYGRSTHGELLTALVNSNDPYNAPVGAVEVDLSVSGGTMTSTAADDWALCLAGHEFIAHRFAALIGPNQYDIWSAILPATTPFMLRSLYGSTPGAAVGSPFVLCDEHLFKLPFKPEDVGKTLYLKFQAFNVFNNGMEDLSTVTAYSFLLTQPPAGGDFPVVFNDIGRKSLGRTVVIGSVPTLIGVIPLTAGSYNAPSAVLGCPNIVHAATLQLRLDDGTVLATVGGVAGGIAHRTAAAGFTLAAEVDAHIVAFADAPGVKAIIESYTI